MTTAPAPVRRTVAATAGPASARRRPTSAAAWLVLVGIAGAGLWSTASLGIDVPTILSSLGNAARFAARMLPLDLPPAGELLGLVLETLAIVLLATLLSVALSIPLALAAARATASGAMARGTARTLIVLARAVPDLIPAIVLMRLFGLGPAAGILAMGIHSVGMVAKLYADAIEDLDASPRIAVASVGATRRQQIWAAIPSALLPQVIATALHRFDINLRTSVLLGYVGVGGIGLAIADALRSLDYQRGMALALVVLVLCIVVELVSGALRAAILPGPSRSATPSTWADRLLRRGGPSADPGSVGITPPWSWPRILRMLGIAAMALLTLAAIRRVHLEPRALLDGLVDLPHTLSLFVPPSFGGARATVLPELLVTIQIALAATFLGSLLALPIGILSAGNVVPHRGVHAAMRMLIVAVRGIPELILAIVFVVISGLGAVAGTLALAVGAVGLLSKLVADSLEETDTSVQEAVRASGASAAQVLAAATLRQAAPAIVAHVLYLLDTNIRSATLLGVVGAGGIGFLLLNAARINQFPVVTTIVLLMIAVVLALEALAIGLRRAIR